MVDYEIKMFSHRHWVGWTASDGRNIVDMTMFDEFKTPFDKTGQAVYPASMDGIQHVTGSPAGCGKPA